MEGAIIGAAVAILLAVLGSSWRLSGQIQGLASRIDDAVARLDRADIEGMRDRITTIEARCPNCRERP